jgi:hypothetical protein
VTNPMAPKVRSAFRPLILSAALAAGFVLGACSGPAGTPATSAPAPISSSSCGVPFRTTK